VYMSVCVCGICVRVCGVCVHYHLATASRLTSSEHFFISTMESAASIKSRYRSLKVKEAKPSMHPLNYLSLSSPTDKVTGLNTTLE
jgi:hypothetical protein